ncbi:MAG TPA: MutS family DNA mismatch repair protein [Longimicrobiales bacterium]
MHTHDDIVSRYLARARRFAAARDRLAERSRRLSWARITVFLAALALLVRAELSADARGAFLAGGAALLAGFIALVAWHGRVKRALRWNEELMRINEEGPLRIARDWDRLPGADFGVADPKHAYAIDLDLFGRASLFQLVGGIVGTAPGRTTLAAWLLAPAAPAEVRERQAAVADLAPRAELRDELAVRGRLQARSRPEDVERFLEWAEGEPWLLRRPALIWAPRLLAVVNVALIVAHAAGWTAAPYWLLSVLAGLGLSWLLAGRIHGVFGRAFAREGAFRQYAELFRVLSAARFDAPRLREIQRSLTSDREPAHRRMRRLERIMELADLRRSGLFHFPVHAVTLWDFHVLFALERWQRASGRDARRWLDALGDAEALAALATLAHDHPDWSFPDVADDGPAVFDARGLGHPLIPRRARVDNDVVVGPPGTVLLVTGSNMSGKSTLLRAIGANAVLARAGGPVCAEALRMPPVQVWSSMRVQDSLSRGVSYFMAELQRLKQVVDAARVAGPEASIVLYLLDEILHGTNTAERHVAAQRVISFLVEHGAIGAVSTHDLALAEAPDLQPAIRPVHFTETVRREDGRMSMRFDYKLREGVATSTNALALMEMVGLGLSDDP